MSIGAEVQGVFEVVEEQQPSFSYNLEEPIISENIPSTDSPSVFLDNLSAKADEPSTTTNTPKPTAFMPAISPSLMLSSMANSSPAAESILTSAKERIDGIRPWKDFFSLDQFRIPESSTAAQSRASHNFSHFQNNYLVILLLLCAFSL